MCILRMGFGDRNYRHVFVMEIRYWDLDSNKKKKGFLETHVNGRVLGGFADKGIKKYSLLFISLLFLFLFFFVFSYIIFKI